MKYNTIYAFGGNNESRIRIRQVPVRRWVIIFVLSVIKSGPNNYYGIDRIPVCTGSGMYRLHCIDILKTNIEKTGINTSRNRINGKVYRSMWQQSMTWCNNVEQYGRRWSLRIHGHKMANRNENCKVEVKAEAHP